MTLKESKDDKVRLADSGQYQRQLTKRKAACDTKIFWEQPQLGGRALLEILLFGGVQWGWVAYVFILKQEGVFENLCFLTKIEVQLNKTSENETTTFKDCFPQDERLNLIFTIGVGVFLGLIFLSGQLFMIFSVKKIRMSFMVMEVAGIMCFAFTSPGNPWLPLPGIVLTGTAGQALLISNYKQVIPLLPRRSSIYVGLLNGCIDSSVISMMAVKGLYENGVDKKISLVGLAIIFIIVAGACTILHPTSKQMDGTVGVIEVKRSADKMEKPEGDTPVLNNSTIKDDKITEGMTLIQNNMSGLTIGRVLCHRLFISQVVWLSIVMLKLNFILGYANRFMDQIIQDDLQVSYFTDVMTYTMLGSMLSSFTAGYTTHIATKLFNGVIGTVLSLVLTSSLGILLSALEFVTIPEALYADFIVLTFFRSFIYVVNVEYIRTTFPMKYLTIVYGVSFSVCGMVNLTQYGIFAWTEGYVGAETHVKVFMLGLLVISLYHPIFVFCTRGDRRQTIKA
ncbi:equilibrative nucleobase transporter 1-like [Argopecten irradians]|uniref:equilibrative nucleobase transporter 1-like n=1 Tax=Argopecten irradians TaxID=31199 RepID=UPI003720DC0D